MGGSAPSSYEMVAAALQDILNVFKQSTEDDPVKVLVSEVMQASSGQIFLHGVGREGLMMKALAMRLYHLGLGVHCAGDMNTPPIGPGDLLLVSAGPGHFGTVDALISVARDAGARVLVITAQPKGSAVGRAHAVAVLPGQTMADAATTESLLPMGSVYEGSLFMLSEVAVLLLRDKLAETKESMRARHTNLE